MLDARLIDIARTCQVAVYGKTMAFPDVIRTLMAATFEGYLVDYRCNTTTYYLPDGQSVVLDNPLSQDGVALDFDVSGVQAAIKWAQTDPADYSYAGFCRRVKALGCAGYLVSFPGRRVLYYGRNADVHVEHFPQ